MNRETLEYKPAIAMRNYGVVLGLLIGVTAVLMYLGIPITVILLKLAVVPLFFLAFGGLEIIYRTHRRTQIYSTISRVLFTGGFAVRFVFIHCSVGVKQNSAGIIRGVCFIFCCIRHHKTLYAGARCE